MILIVVVVVLNCCRTAFVQELFIKPLQYPGCNPDDNDCSQIVHEGNCMVTMSGCQCLDTWYFDGKPQNGCTNPDDSPQGNWCELKPGSCTSKTYSKKYEYCHPNCLTVPLVQQSSFSGIRLKTSRNLCPTMVEGKDYTGGDLMPPIIVEDQFACQKICGLSKECKFFTFDKDDKQCWLKGYQFQMNKNSNTISGAGCS